MYINFADSHLSIMSYLHSVNYRTGCNSVHESLFIHLRSLRYPGSSLLANP